jgi:hypothetical protein
MRRRMPEPHGGELHPVVGAAGLRFGGRLRRDHESINRARPCILGLRPGSMRRGRQVASERSRWRAQAEHAKSKVDPGTPRLVTAAAV